MLSCLHPNIALFYWIQLGEMEKILLGPTLQFARALKFQVKLSISITQSTADKKLATMSDCTFSSNQSAVCRLT